MLLREIPDYPNYFATKSGDIYSRHRKTGDMYKLRQRIQNNGRYYCRLPKGWTQVARLVCSAWRGKPPNKSSECRHLNGRKLDNRASNLVWGTKRQNQFDKVTHQKTRLTPKTVRQIRRYLIEGSSMSELAQVFSVSYHTIYFLAQGMTWRRQDCGLTKEFREWQRKNLDGRV